MRPPSRMIASPAEGRDPKGGGLPVEGVTRAPAKRLKTALPSARVSGVTDVHVHIQPFEMLKPEILDGMKRERQDFDILLRMARDPRAFLAHLDAVGVDRACLINYVAPEVMG